MAASTKIKIKVCENCGKSFETVHYQQKFCCKTCYEISHREMERLRARDYYQHSKSKSKTRKNKNVDKVAKKAKELGMSYGQYTALYGI